MAGDWIPVRIDLHEDPAVMAIAEQLGCREEVVVGYLVRIWGWVSRQCNADTVTDVTLSALGRVTSLPGVPELMVQVGWLETGETDDGRPFIRIVNYDRWLSKTAKVRATTRLRVKKTRENGGENVTEMYQKCNGASVTKSLPQNRTEQKRTEETKEKKSIVLSEDGNTKKRVRNSYTEEFEAFWKAYPHRSQPNGKAITFEAYRRLAAEDREDLMVATANFSRTDKAMTNFAPDPVRFIKNRFWLDYLELSEAQLQNARLTPEERERADKRRRAEIEMEAHRAAGEARRAQGQKPLFTPELRKP